MFPTPLHQQQQSDLLLQGRMDPYFHVVYAEFWLYNLNVTKTHYYSKIVHFWSACVNCRLSKHLWCIHVLNFLHWTVKITFPPVASSVHTSQSVFFPQVILTERGCSSQSASLSIWFSREQKFWSLWHRWEGEQPPSQQLQHRCLCFLDDISW